MGASGQRSDAALTTGVIVQGDGSTGSGRRAVPAFDMLRYEDIARQAVMNIPAADIASNLGISVESLASIVRKRGFLEVLERVKTAIYLDVDATTRNEKIEPILRARSQAIRAQTLITEVMEEVRNRIASGDAKAMDLKVGTEAAFGIIDRSRTELALPGRTGASAAPAVTFNFNAGGPQLVAATIAESGVSFADLAPSLVDDTPPIPDEPA